ncbi:MAG TPA: polysaccharide deacetylase family protein [Bacteroidia bacterium]|jgi:peptidoglycan/xylan/chitin deacetylase (PgdA/CDA1 family)|nr:polysaccharide deacetylase family protein [Bacteroidia bacterium]
MHLARIPGLGSLLFRDALCRINESDKKVAYLTFDDGPIPEVTPTILDILSKYGVKATFFCVGDNVRKHPEIFQRLIKEGHTIGNHTFHHMDGWKASDENYISDIAQCAELVKSNLFRPPYGRLKFSQYKRVKEKYKIVLWDVLSGDYDMSLSGQKCFEIVKKNTRPGSILVFHDNIKAQNKISELLTKTLDYMGDSGYMLKPLSSTI